MNPLIESKGNPSSPRRDIDRIASSGAAPVLIHDDARAFEHMPRQVWLNFEVVYVDTGVCQRSLELPTREQRNVAYLPHGELTFDAIRDAWLAMLGVRIVHAPISLYRQDICDFSALRLCTAEAKDQYGQVIDWPTSHVMSDAGFMASCRSLHAGIGRVMDRTWTPRFLDQQQGRIDYVYEKGSGVQAVATDVVDEYAVLFPSEHAALVSS